MIYGKCLESLREKVILEFMSALSLNLFSRGLNIFQYCLIDSSSLINRRNNRKETGAVKHRARGWDFHSSSSSKQLCKRKEASTPLGSFTYKMKAVLNDDPGFLHNAKCTDRKKRRFHPWWYNFAQQPPPKTLCIWVLASCSPWPHLPYVNGELVSFLYSCRAAQTLSSFTLGLLISSSLHLPSFMSF